MCHQTLKTHNWHVFLNNLSLWKYHCTDVGFEFQFVGLNPKRGGWLTYSQRWDCYDLFCYFQINMTNALAVRALGFGFGIFFLLAMCVLNNCVSRNFKSSAARNSSSNFVYLCLKCLRLAARAADVCMGALTRRKAENRDFQMALSQGALVRSWHVTVLLQQSRGMEKQLQWVIQ